MLGPNRIALLINVPKNTYIMKSLHFTLIGPSVYKLCVPKEGPFYIGTGIGTAVLPETHVNNISLVFLYYLVYKKFPGNVSLNMFLWKKYNKHSFLQTFGSSVETTNSIQTKFPRKRFGLQIYARNYLANFVYLH